MIIHLIRQPVKPNRASPSKQLVLREVRTDLPFRNLPIVCLRSDPHDMKNGHWSALHIGEAAPEKQYLAPLA